jgi:UDP-N-acetylmuramoyl-L-alanyl-D-glutamate--2,6-diaminopimelate ligase
LTELGYKTGLISTIEYRIGADCEPSTHTTPDALDTNRLLRRMVDEGCSACVMEVSSHALVQERVHTIDYSVAVFTNLSQDHLDYHETMAAYRDAKRRLFDGLKPEAAAVYNADDPVGSTMIEDCAARPWAYSLERETDLSGRLLGNTLECLRLSIDGLERSYRLIGRFNAYNLLAAYGVAQALGQARDESVAALASAHPVPGRFEILRVSNGRFAVVDYAHTPDALENVLRTLKETKPVASTLWCVFGCGGDRDAGKRPQMGRIAETLADRVIVTSDNPRTEDPGAILEDIKTGMAHPRNALWIVNRRDAIREAAEKTTAGDVVLIAGKGHEPYQVIGTERIHFDDREEALAAFAAE